jgi:hypothetical protein
VDNTQRFGNSAKLSEESGKSSGNSWRLLAVLLGFSVFASDTGSRGSNPLNFAEKTGISLTFSHVQLTIRQSAQNFERLFFACLKGEFNPHFRAFLGQIGTNSLEATILTRSLEASKLGASSKP